MEGKAESMVSVMVIKPGVVYYTLVLLHTNLEGKTSLLLHEPTTWTREGLERCFRIFKAKGLDPFSFEGLLKPILQDRSVFSYIMKDKTVMGFFLVKSNSRGQITANEFERISKEQEAGAKEVKAHWAKHPDFPAGTLVHGVAEQK